MAGARFKVCRDLPCLGTQNCKGALPAVLTWLVLSFVDGGFGVPVQDFKIGRKSILFVLMQTCPAWSRLACVLAMESLHYHRHQTELHLCTSPDVNIPTWLSAGDAVASGERLKGYNGSRPSPRDAGHYQNPMAAATSGGVPGLGPFANAGPTELTRVTGFCHYAIDTMNLTHYGHYRPNGNRLITEAELPSWNLTPTDPSYKTSIVLQNKQPHRLTTRYQYYFVVIDHVELDNHSPGSEHEQGTEDGRSQADFWWKDGGELPPSHGLTTVCAVSKIVGSLLGVCTDKITIMHTGEFPSVVIPVYGLLNAEAVSTLFPGSTYKHYQDWNGTQGRLWPIAAYTWSLLRFVNAHSTLSYMDKVQDELWRFNVGPRKKHNGSWRAALVRYCASRCVGCGKTTPGLAPSDEVHLCDACKDDITRPGLLHAPKHAAKKYLPANKTRALLQLVTRLPHTTRHYTTQQVSVRAVVQLGLDHISSAAPDGVSKELRMPSRKSAWGDALYTC